MEDDFLEAERASVQDLAAAAPDVPDEFMEWFLELRNSGPGQGDALFPWLAAPATFEQM